MVAGGGCVVDGLRTRESGLAEATYNVTAPGSSGLMDPGTYHGPLSEGLHKLYAGNDGDHFRKHLNEN